LKAFNIDFAVIGKFGLVSISPPISPEQIDEKLDELTQRQKKYLADGAAVLEKEKSDILRDIERIVDEDIEAEVKAAAEQEDAYGDEEERDEERRHSHRGRGGFAKTYGGREQEEEKGGHFGQEAAKKKGPKDAFFDGSDSDEPLDSYNSAYTKPSRGGGQQVNQ